MSGLRAIQVAAIVLWAGSVQASEVVVGMSPWPPYIDPKLPGHGLAASIVSAAFERAGYEPVLVLGPWERTLEATKLGEISVVAAAWRTRERERDFAFSRAYLTNEVKFLKREGSPLRFETLQDLDGLRVGVVYLYTYGEAFDKATGFTKAPETHIVPNLLQLLAGNIDLAVGDERTLRYEINRHLAAREGELEFLPKPLRSHDLHVAVSRSDPEFEAIVTRFDRGLEEIQADGTYRKLLRQANEEIWKRSYLPH